jgi:hypothetical protein
MSFTDFFGILFFCIWPLIAITIIAGIIVWKRKDAISLLKDFISTKPYDNVHQTDIQGDSSPNEQRIFTNPNNSQSSEPKITYSPARVNNYTSIKSVASFFVFAAWLFLIIGSIASTFYLFNTGFDLIKIGTAFLIFLLFGTSAFFFIFSAQGIYVILDIEANSRQTAKTLEKILRILSANDIEL